MVDSADFDEFYADARERLLHQCYALTGDLPASQAAVRDAFVSAWHHWRKVARTGDPERWARPVAWAHAHRRSGARVFHRDRSDDADLSATLEALGKLSFVQRRVLVLSTLTRSSLEELAREAGLTRDAAERELQSATATFTLHRGAEPGMVRFHLDRLRRRLEDVSWPRVTIVRRQGTTRRRGYTVAGVAAVVALVIGSGAAVGYDGHAHPTLAQEREALVPTPVQISEAPAPPPELDDTDLLAATQLERLAPKVRWRVAETTQNLEGDGLVLPCQQARFADAKATGALVRTYAPARKRSPYSAYQLTELSKSTQAAKRTFATSVGWYAGCPADRVQLVSTRSVHGVGDQAALLVLRGWARPTSTMVVGVARTGQVTTTVLSEEPGNGALSPPALASRGSLLAAAVNGLCGSPGTGTCAGPPQLRPRPPYPVGLVPGMLSSVDMPPVTGVDSSWVGTDPKKALVNTAATQCDADRLQRRAVQRGLDPHVPVPAGEAPRHLRADRDGRPGAAQGGRGLRRGAAQADGRVRGPQPRHRGRQGRRPAHPGRRAGRVAGHRRGLRPAHRDLPDGHRAHRQGGRPGRLHPHPRGADVRRGLPGPRRAGPAAAARAAQTRRVRRAALSRLGVRVRRARPSSAGRSPRGSCRP